MSSKVWVLSPLLIFIAAFLVVGCQPVKVLNGVTPRSGFNLQRDLAYGSEARQTMDIYLPTKRPWRSAVLVFVHGGAWETGAKEDFLFVGQTFARLGYVTVIPNYRLYPEVEFPDLDRKSTRLNSSHVAISYAVFCLKKKKNQTTRCGRAA